MKKCSTCKQLKDFSSFHKNKYTKVGLQSCCKICDKSRLSKWKKNNAASVRKHTSFYRKNNPEQVKRSCRSRDLKRFNNISIEEYDVLFVQQRGCCAGCQRHQFEFKQHLAVDHDHQTGRIRGLLCHGCNTFLGHMKDNPILLSTALTNLITYLVGSQQGHFNPNETIGLTANYNLQ